MPKLAKAEWAELANDRVRIWDPVVRIFHWSLVASVATAWFSANVIEGLHYWAGYAAAGLIGMRLLWGVLGTPYARFSQFVRHPLTIIGYLRDIASGREVRYLGHNPAGGAMVVALIVTLFGTALSGWLMTTDAFWGVAWMQEVHDLVAHLLLVLVLAHLAGVALASLRHKENLVAAMVHGRKRAPGPQDVAE